jgi:hypothetical protein
MLSFVDNANSSTPDTVSFRSIWWLARGPSLDTVNLAKGYLFGPFLYCEELGCVKVQTSNCAAAGFFRRVMMDLWERADAAYSIHR